MQVKIVVAFILSLMVIEARAQAFYFGADLSYVNEMEACGAVYTSGGVATDPYTIFKDHGSNLVRLRIWHTPSWYDQLNDGNRYSDLADVAVSISRAKNAGLKVLLDFHLSDTWADPGHQVVPSAWAAVVDNQAVLADSLHDYIYATLSYLGDNNLLPDIIQIGNETNRGILLSQATNDAGWTLDWNRNVALFQAAQHAVEEIEVAYAVPIKTAIHIADPEDVEWYVEQFTTHGFTSFDIIGISYYWQWHQPVTISGVGAVVSRLKQNYPGKEVMLFETAYGWTTQNADAANNILFNTAPGYAPLSPENQKRWMTDLTQKVIDNGGSGVVYWEPAWVSTGCSTQWVQGSSWDNATFFDFNKEVMEEGGIGWMQHPYDFVLSTQDEHTSSSTITFQYVGGAVLIKAADDSRLTFPCRFNIYNLDGRLIESSSFESFDEMNSKPISIPGMSTGLYLGTLEDRIGKMVSGKIWVINR